MFPKKAIFAGLAVDSSWWHVGGRISRSIRLFSVGAAVQQGGPVNSIHYDPHLLRVTPDRISAQYTRPATSWGRRTSFWWLRDRCNASAFISPDPYRGASSFFLIEAAPRRDKRDEWDKRKSENDDVSHSSPVLIPPSRSVTASTVRRDL